MASYTIISNALSGEYIDKYTQQAVVFKNETYHPGLIQFGISRFKVTFTNDKDESVTQEHEVASIRPEDIDEQLKITLDTYNNRNGKFTAPEIETDKQVML